MRLLLVRHGESICGQLGVVGGATGCTGLTDVGKAQARALGERLARTGEATPATVYASTLPRAVQTAEAVAEAVGAPEVRFDAELREFDPGELDGTRWEDWADRFDPWTAPGRLIAPGGESLEVFQGRVRGLLDRFADDHDGENVVACCHGGVIGISFAVLFGLARPDERQADFQAGFTSITEWERTDGSWRLVRLNDMAHLHELEHATGGAP